MPSESNFFTMTGDCDVQGDCVSSNNYPNVHGNSESCSVTMLQDAGVVVGNTFNLEACCDNLMIGGVDVESSASVPGTLNAGDVFQWSSDFIVTREGWQLCFEPTITPTDSSGTFCNICVAHKQKSPRFL